MAKVYLDTTANKSLYDKFLREANLKIERIVGTAIKRAIPKIKAEMTEMILVKLGTGRIYRGLAGLDEFSGITLRAEFRIDGKYEPNSG